MIHDARWFGEEHWDRDEEKEYERKVRRMDEEKRCWER
jgi:hypothetical protein